MLKEVSKVEDPKALEIVRLFSQGKNASEVARLLGYGSHNSVNQYMRRRGYQWDPRLGNYVKKSPGEDKPSASPAFLEVLAGGKATGTPGREGEATRPAPRRAGRAAAPLPAEEEEPPAEGGLAVLGEEGADREAVRELLRRAPQLLRLLRSLDTPESRLGLRPRERARPEVTKGFRISVELDRRLEQFCSEHGVMQKDVLETALWEFLESRSDARG